MKFAAPLGSLLVLLFSVAAQAQVMGGYTTIAPTQLGSAPVFDSTPLFNTPGKAIRVQRASMATTAADQLETDRAARAAAIDDLDRADETRSVLKKTGGSEVTFANYQAANQQAPATFTPVEESLSPIPMTMTGGAAYYQPSLGAQVIPVQASAAVPMSQNPCCNPCVTCCMPVSQVAQPTVISQPSYVQQPISLASAPSQLPPNHVFGRGILFQPVVYVEGQPLRNFFRFISP